MNLERKLLNNEGTQDLEIIRWLDSKNIRGSHIHFLYRNIYSGNINAFVDGILNLSQETLDRINTMSLVWFNNKNIDFNGDVIKMRNENPEDLVFTREKARLLLEQYPEYYQGFEIDVVIERVFGESQRVMKKGNI